jgi:hypothetical protein
MISVSHREIEGQIFNMINSFTPLVPQIPLPSLTAALYVDWMTKTLRDINGDFVDDLQVRSGKDNEANLSTYKYLDNSSILVMNRNLHSQTVSGLPVALQGYDGDLSLVYTGLSMSTSANSISLTTIDTNVDVSTDYLSGWRISLYNGSLNVIIGREGGSGNNITISTLLTDQLPFAGKIHTLSFVYIADNGSGVSSLRAFWDGISVAYVEKAYSPLSWHTSNNIYMGRFYLYPIFSTTYNA